MISQQRYWGRVFQDEGALWFHDGNMERPHALLTGDMHSNGFFKGKIVTENPRLLSRAVAMLVGSLQEHGCNIYLIDRVVGPATGATKLAKAIAEHIAKVCDHPCHHSSPEKDDSSGVRKMVFRDTRVIPGEMVLLCEDTVTTGGSIRLTRSAVDDAGGDTLPHILALLNRGNGQYVGGKRVVSLLHQPMPIWTPDKCPYCKAGSKAIRPKEGDNWARLNAEY